ncbi:ABC transporter permease [Silvanigrella aquatica]|uniref:Sugar ABC transporter permease n=1 Tax=Silvanigrella aquatica TaxID=1915309 RepID=A0A1L4CWW9_9BACT|nr:ABC transporter permease [Silvanigrella aquatica]APJ02436.1 sugar ABC transporter permease [Silvanigrella aquatica]
MELTEWLNNLSSIGGSTIRMSAPLIFAALGGLMSERSGIINIALEGKMLAGAFTAAAVTTLTHSPFLGFLCGGLAGMLMAALYGLFVINFKSNQIVTGTAITILAAGTVPFISQILFQNTGSTPEIPMGNRFIHGPIIAAWVIMGLIWLWFKYSPYGMWHKFAGEHPDALQTSGIDVIRTRWSGVLLSGFLAGLGGATLSICLSSSYTRNMTAGRGYMALAALIVGGWRPIAAALACLAFGFFDALGIFLQGIQMPKLTADIPFVTQFWNFLVSPQFIQIIPYILTIVIVAGFVGKSRAPRALGQPYLRNR